MGTPTLPRGARTPKRPAEPAPSRARPEAVLMDISESEPRVGQARESNVKKANSHNTATHGIRSQWEGRASTRAPYLVVP